MFTPYDAVDDMISARDTRFSSVLKETRRLSLILG